MSKATERPVNWSEANIRKSIVITDASKIYTPQIVTKRDSKGRPTEFSDVLYEDASGQVIYASARHEATNYDAVRNKIKKDQGCITDDQYRQCKIAAAEVIVEQMKKQDIHQMGMVADLEADKQSLVEMAGVSSFAKFKLWVTEAITWGASNRTYKMQADGYRCQIEAFAIALELEGVDAEVIKRARKAATKGQPTAKTVAKNLAKLTDWEQSEILTMFKKLGAIKS